MDEAQEKCKRRTLFMLRMRKIVNNRIRGESHGENDVQIKGGSKEKVFVGVARFPTSKDKRTFSLRGGAKRKILSGPRVFRRAKTALALAGKEKEKKREKEKRIYARARCKRRQGNGERKCARGTRAHRCSTRHPESGDKNNSTLHSELA